MAILNESNLSQIANGDELDDDEEEPGEVIESAPPLKVGEERSINDSGLKKKLIKRGVGWETPSFGDEVTGRKGLDMGIVTMKKGEVALFTLPSDIAYGNGGSDTVPLESVVQFEVELISWIMVVDVCKDGGIIKRIVGKGRNDNQPSELDEVLVKYQIMLSDGTVVAKAAEEGVEFCVKDGHLLPALTKAIRTMKVEEKVNLIVQPQYGFGDIGKVGEPLLSSIPPNASLNIDLQLVSMKRVIDVCGDSMVIKKILEEGENLSVAGEGAAVTVRYIAKLEDDTIFDKKGFDGEAPLDFITDEEQVVPGLDRAVATMKRREKALLTIRSKYGFGEAEVKKGHVLIPPSSTLFFEIEMVDFFKEKEPWELTMEDRLMEAGKKKEEGNVLYKSGKYQRAGKKYDKAVDYVGEDASFGDEQQKQVKVLRVHCWLNAAACSLKREDYKEAIKLCSKVLDVEFHNIKALYRRAQAYMRNDDLDLAELDIKKALEVDPDNREVKLLQKTLKQRQAESNQQDAKLYANMFPQPAKNLAVVTKKLKVDEEKSVGTKNVSVSSALDDEDENNAHPS
ncbi:peptidyl-prolyl cis-trans isomerase FKBP62-like isoform X2 [Amaranthus tricolor]|uniref:peptidyl-prolyl cis-trans isomerase FKBP62-like isoform X2 n=1 Tax=Amaranthus tricolor TaxID=29722 RepID=UPI0025855A81|nr:peptidyl-prolyl cis-trans isomerase FKBP62-like isoform X2 [Amaranthus tricolor]